MRARAGVRACVYTGYPEKTVHKQRLRADSWENTQAIIIFELEAFRVSEWDNLRFTRSGMIQRTVLKMKADRRSSW